MYYLFRTGTTGLLKLKKSKPLATMEDALSAGRAMNILDGTPDRVFIILHSDSLKCYTNITDPLEFSETFFRLPRLSDSTNKFATQAQRESALSRTDFDLTPESQELYGMGVAASINQSHPAIEVPIESLRGKTIHRILSDAGLSKANIYSIQSSIQWELGIIPMHRALSFEESRILATINRIIPSNKEANQYLSDLAMSRMTIFGTTELCKKIPFPAQDSTDII